jgi:hypothetical protein
MLKIKRIAIYVIFGLVVSLAPIPSAATVTTTVTSVTYTGSGGSTFTITFPFLLTAHIVVTRITIADSTELVFVEGVDYTISRTGATGGTVTTTSPVTSSYQIQIERTVPITQTTNFRTQGRFSPGSHEDAVDKLTMIIQQLGSDVVQSQDTADALSTHIGSADDHTAYFRLAGRSGGQNARGGTAAGENLTLQSTAHATKGFIYFGTASAYDQTQDFFGIGDLTPDYDLDIAGDIFITGSAYLPTIYGSIVSGGDLTLLSTSHATKGHLYIGTASAYDETQDKLLLGKLTHDALFTGELEVTTAAKTPIIQGSTASGGDLQLKSSTHATRGSIILSTSATGVVVDDVNYRLGIGTAAPSDDLHVAGGALFAETSGEQLITVKSPESENALIQFEGDGTGTEYYIGRGDASDQDTFSVGIAGGNQHITILNDGKVGISATVPVDTLHVGGGAQFIEASGEQRVNINSPESEDSLVEWKGDGSGTEYCAGRQDAADEDIMVLGVCGSPGLYIDPTGKVGVATSTPSYGIDINGTANISGNVTFGGELTMSSIITATNTGLHVLDTDASHDLIWRPASNLSADRTLNVATGDADRTLTLSGNLTVESASLLDQDLTMDSATAQLAGLNLTGTLLDSGSDLALGAACDAAGSTGNVCIGGALLTVDNLAQFDGVATFGNTNIHMLDINASHDLILTTSSDITVDRTFTLVTGDSDRSLTFEGNAIVSQDYSTDGAVQFGSLTLSGSASVGTDLTVTDALTVDGTTLFVDNATNRVGIGTLAPDLDLDVHGDFIITGSAYVPTLYGSTASGGNLLLRSTSHATQGKIIFGGAAGTDVVFDDVNNRLGIGTATPSEPLHVVGGALLIETSGEQLITIQSPESENSLVQFEGDGTGTEYYLGRADASNQDAFAIGIAGGNPAIWVDNSGNVGINDISPGVQLSVTGAASITGDVHVDATTFVVDTAANEVGIGTASPGAPLDVVGKVLAGVRTGADPASSFSVGTATGTLTAWIENAAGKATDISLELWAGLYTHGGSAGDNKWLDLRDGNGTHLTYIQSDAGAGGAFSVVSDARLKEHIEPTAVRGLDVVNRLQLRQFDWVDNERPSVKLGVVAQEALEVYPDMVSYDENTDLYHVSIGALDLVAIKAIQELSTQVEAQQKQIDALLELIEENQQ